MGGGAVSSQVLFTAAVPALPLRSVVSLGGLAVLAAALGKLRLHACLFDNRGQDFAGQALEVVLATLPVMVLVVFSAGLGVSPVLQFCKCTSLSSIITNSSDPIADLSADLLGGREP